jgi:methyl-accepting chemotaxis protein
MNKNLSVILRKNIISFTWTWMCLLIIIGILSLFSIWMMSKTFETGSEFALKISALKGEMSSANIAFKVEIQEWKNILLRGKNNDDRQFYLSKFEKQQRRVNANLNNAALICAQLKLEESCKQIQAIDAQHDQLVDKYMKNLLDSNLENYDGIHKLDESVRGLDRDVEKKLSNLVAVYSDIEIKKYMEIQELIHNKYESLKLFISGVMIFALMLTSIGLYRILSSIKS